MFKYGFPRDIKAICSLPFLFLVAIITLDLMWSTNKGGRGVRRDLELGGPPAGISTLYPFTLAVDNAANFVHFTEKFKITVKLFNAESWPG